VSKRNDVVGEVLKLLRAAATEHLSSLDDETEIVRGPEALLAGLDDLDLAEQKVWVEVADDEMEPATLARDGHSMAIYVLVAMRAADRQQDMPDVIDFGDEVERAVLADRSLGGEVQECHPVKFTPGWLEGEQDTLAIVHVGFLADFHTTN